MVCHKLGSLKHVQLATFLSGGVEVQVRGRVDLESSAPDSCPTATWTQFQVPLVPQENGQLAADFEWSLPLHSRYPVSFSP